MVLKLHSDWYQREVAGLEDDRSNDDSFTGVSVGVVRDEQLEKYYHPFETPTLLPNIVQQNTGAVSRVSPTSDDSSRSDSPGRPPRMAGQSWSERVKVHRPPQRAVVKLPKMERTVKV